MHVRRMLWGIWFREFLRMPGRPRVYEKRAYRHVRRDTAEGGLIEHSFALALYCAKVSQG
jgi:hypothetical protein